ASGDVRRMLSPAKRNAVPCWSIGHASGDVRRMLSLRDGQGMQVSAALGEGTFQNRIGLNGHLLGLCHWVRLGLVRVARELQQGAVDLGPGFHTALPLGTGVERQLDPDARADEDRLTA